MKIKDVNIKIYQDDTPPTTTCSPDNLDFQQQVPVSAARG